MLVRAWNLFHGNTVPTGRHAYLREMIELVTADRPTVVCLQEVPAWALELVGEWADMQAVSVRTRRPKLGAIAIPGGLGRRLASINAGRARSAPGGQGNVILLPKDVQLRQAKQITLNTNPFCEEQATKLGLTMKDARWWEKERRVCHVAKIEFPDRQRMLVANLHATSQPADLRLANAELRRAAAFVDRSSEIGEIVILAGDFNTTLEQSETLRELTTRPDDRYSAAGPRIDHILVRGTVTSAVRVWPDDDRLREGKLLSDHAPVELELGGKAGEAAQAEAEAQPAPPSPPAPAPSPPPAADERPPVTTVDAPKEDDRWETPGDERWETPGDQRWETDA
jgi:endonuclease/exonuclease/phosphatase family metal-dependent hydrolase